MSASVTLGELREKQRAEQQRLWDSPRMSYAFRKAAMLHAARECGVDSSNFVSVAHAHAWAEFHNQQQQLRCVIQNQND